MKRLGGSCLLLVTKAFSRSLLWKRTHATELSGIQPCKEQREECSLPDEESCFVDAVFEEYSFRFKIGKLLNRILCSASITEETRYLLLNNSEMERIPRGKL